MARLYSLYGRGQPEFLVLPPPIPFENAPTASQDNYAIGQVVYTPPTSPNAFYMYAGAGNWVEFATDSDTILSVNGTANQISSSTSSGVVTLSIPSSFVAPGSIAATTSVTATLGNITATNGNMVMTTSGTGLVFTPVSGSGAASGSVTSNGRSGTVSFTSPSIAGGATVTLTMSNSSITGSGTVILYSISGATTGAALTIQSITNSSASSAVVISNGTGATTQSSTITLTYLILN